MPSEVAGTVISKYHKVSFDVSRVQEAFVIGLGSASNIFLWFVGFVNVWIHY